MEMSTAAADRGQDKTQMGLVRQVTEDESGFTLVEIIAVLVILGILAAVAVPKYFDLQSKAKEKAFAGALAEASGRVTQYFGQQILEGVDHTLIDYTAENLGTDMGDFTLAVTAGGVSGTEDDITLQVTANLGTAMAGESATKTIPRPGAP
jgi:prepilin-type N-terminal cleavage/methylation domain-containing protein